MHRLMGGPSLQGWGRDDKAAKQLFDYLGKTSHSRLISRNVFSTLSVSLRTDRRAPTTEVVGHANTQTEEGP